MTKLSAQVKGSLNVTTPGVQIWRLEVRILPGHRAGSAAGDGLSSTLPCWGVSPWCQPHLLLRHQPPLILLPLPALLILILLVSLLFLSQLSVWLKGGREAGGPGWSTPSLLRPCRWCLFLPTPSAASSMVTAM